MARTKKVCFKKLERSGFRQGQLQTWTEHSTLIFENQKPVEKSKNCLSIIWLSSKIVVIFKISSHESIARILSASFGHLQKYKINTTFEDIQMMLQWCFDFSSGFRFSKISVECSVHICSCPWFSIYLGFWGEVWLYSDVGKGYCWLKKQICT